MSPVLIALFVFLGAYLLNSFYVTVLYHRGLTHGAVKLAPWAERWVAWTGNWVTGIDPKGWSCMHRLHHKFSDTPDDPHSPVHQGVFGLLFGQLHSYNRTLSKLIRGAEPETSTVSDLSFNVNWLNRKHLWMLPYLLHASISATVIYFTGTPWIGLGYYLGIMSHPMQGWMVNSLGHRFGYRNFETPDNSRNHTLTALLVVGEGYQNNHHQSPASAKFSVRPTEFDSGYLMCLAAEKMGILKINSEGADTVEHPPKESLKHNFVPSMQGQLESSH